MEIVISEIILCWPEKVNQNKNEDKEKIEGKEN